MTTWYCDTCSNTNTNHGYTTWSNDSCSSSHSSLKAQAPLGKGSISKLALHAVELGLNPKCYSDDGGAYLSVSSYNVAKVTELSEYATEIGFKKGDVNIKGESCPCTI